MTDILKDAQLLFNESMDVARAQREQMAEDLRFSDPSDPQQWDEQVKRSREQDAGGKRPCLVLDQINQYVANIAGQVESNPPAIHAIPTGGGANKLAAEQLDGRFRHIEQTSRASQHYARAMTSAARTGVGYLVVRPDYTNRALGHQEPRIYSEPDPLKVVLDPWSTETDGSDAKFGYILTPISTKTFHEKYKGKELRDFGDTAATRNDERKQVMLAEEWSQTKKQCNIIVYTDAQGNEASGDEDDYHEACQAAGTQLDFVRNYKDSKIIVNWRRYSGADMLEESEYQSDYIGIVPVYGYVGFIDGRMTYCGLPRRARHAQQSYNYHISEQLAYSISAPKSPWIASVRAIAGMEGIWDKASTQSRAYLPFNDVDVNGAISMPSRTNTSTNVQVHSEGAAQALRDIQASLGMYQSTLGAQGNETSAIAIEARNKQSSASTSHFQSHMAASLGHVGRVVMQMDARLSDTEREHTTLNVDGSTGKYGVSPAQKTAFERSENGAVVNPRVGDYDVRVVVGASYATQRSQTNAAFTEMMRSNPDLAPTVAPFWAQTLDFAGSDKFAQAMAEMSPPPVKAILQPESTGEKDQNSPQKMAQQMQQMQAATKQLQDALNEAVQHAKDAQEDADKAIQALSEERQNNELKEREANIKAYEAETKRLSVIGVNADQAQELVRGLIEEMIANPSPMDGEDTEPQDEAPKEPVVNHELQALLQSHAQLADGQNKLNDAVGQLINHTKAPRKNTAVRDSAGNIIHTIQSIEEPQEPPQIQQEQQ